MSKVTGKLAAESKTTRTSAIPAIEFIADDSRRRSLTSTGTEIRVHGVGDHATFSALGRPGYENRRTSQVVICEPPQLPAHRLLLIAWSRANRRLTRTLWWYLLFPFTLINVAGHMTPRRRHPARLLRAGVSLVSIVLTICLAAWVTVILETIALALAGSPDHIAARFLLSVSGPVVVGAVIASRMRRTDSTSGCGQVCSSAHLIALAALAVTSFLRPAEWTYSGRPVGVGVRALQADTVDPMAYLLIASTGVVLAVAFGLAVVAVHTRLTTGDAWSARDGSALAAAALLLVVATSVLHTAASLLRLVAAEVTGVIDDIRDRVVGHDSQSTHMLLPHPEGITSALRMDLLLGFFVALGVILAVNVFAAAAINVAVGRRSATEPAHRDDGTRPMSLWHRILRYAPGCLSFVALSTVVMTLAAWTAMAVHLDNMSVFGVSLSRNITIVFGVVVVGFVIIRRPERAGEWIKGIFETVADIAGFWAPRSVPLAGASYRSILMDGIDSAIEQADGEPVALVGHSQGSVICAWYMYSLPRPQTRITLFTCGSPLWSLYAAFFPTYFGREFFQRVSANSAGREWFNYWRLTDPIATALPCAHDDDVTETRSEPLRGHSEYWREPQLREHIDRALAVGPGLLSVVGRDARQPYVR